MSRQKRESKLEGTRIATLMQENRHPIKIISVPKDLSLRDRISVVTRLICEWIESQAESFDLNEKGLLLSDFRGTSSGYTYRYEVFNKHPH